MLDIYFEIKMYKEEIQKLKQELENEKENRFNFKGNREELNHSMEKEGRIMIEIQDLENKINKLEAQKIENNEKYKPVIPLKNELSSLENELSWLKNKISKYEEKLKETTNEEEQIEYKYQIKILNEEIEQLEDRIKQLKYEIDEMMLEIEENERIEAQKRVEKERIEAQTLEEEKKKDLLYKKLYVELTDEDLEKIPNLSKNSSKEEKIWSLVICTESERNMLIKPIVIIKEFNKLNTTTDSIYELEDYKVLIILKDGTNLTSWGDVENKEDIIFIIEDLSSEIDLCGKYADLINLKAVVTLNLNGTNMERMFYNCQNLISICNMEDWDVSNVTNMQQMFYNCQNLVNIDCMGDWDVSNVTNMQQMFERCPFSNIYEVSFWNVSNVTNMQQMFKCTNISNIDDLEFWDVYNVKSMKGMFSNCSNLVSINGLTTWDVSSVENMEKMFFKCESLINASSLSSWDLSKLKTDERMFEKCHKLKEYPTWYSRNTEGNLNESNSHIPSEYNIKQLTDEFDSNDILLLNNNRFVMYDNPIELLKKFILYHGVNETRKMILAQIELENEKKKLKNIYDYISKDEIELEKYRTNFLFNLYSDLIGSDYNLYAVCRALYIDYECKPRHHLIIYIYSNHSTIEIRKILGLPH